MTAQDIRRDLQEHVGGGGIMTFNEIKSYLRCGRAGAVKFVKNLEYINIGEGAGATKKYLIREVAQEIYRSKTI